MSANAAGYPNDKPLYEHSIRELGSMLRQGTVSATQLAEDALDRIERLDLRINSFITVTPERARADAAQADWDFATGIDRGPMQGIPYALKDLFETAAIPTTAHSHLFADHVPEADCTVAARLRDGGAILLGKLSTYELATAGPDFSLPFPPARNPWNPDHIPGGSSSGAGAAVAAGLVRVAIGSDTAGSIRAPAGYCGIVGVKPTYGLVSRHGALPLAWSLDHCGPLAWSADDAAIALGVIAGHDPCDPASVAAPASAHRPSASPEPLRVGVPRHFFTTDATASAEVLRELNADFDVLARRGAVIEDMALPPYELFSACGRIIMFAEAFAVNEASFRDRPSQMGRHMYQRMGVGAFISSAELIRAQRVRRELSIKVTEMFRKYDVIVTAGIMDTAPRFDALTQDIAPIVPMQCVPFNVTGHPAIAVPTGFAENGLPVSMQLAGPAFSEARLLELAGVVEAELGSTARRPRWVV